MINYACYFVERVVVKNAFVLFCMLVLSGASVSTMSVVSAAEYRIDLSHSFVQFRTQHLGFSWLIGRFNQFEGTFEYDATDNQGPKAVRVELQTASVDSNHAERDKHLRSSDFLDTDTYPRAVFTSSAYSGDADGGQLSGELTLHGVTRPLLITMHKIGEGADPWGGHRVGFEGSAVITRSDFGMDYDLGPMTRQVELSLYVEGVRN